MNKKTNDGPSFAVTKTCDGCKHFVEKDANDRDGGKIGYCGASNNQVIPGGGLITPAWCPKS